MDGELSISKKRLIRSQTSPRSWLEIEMTFRQVDRDLYEVRHSSAVKEIRKIKPLFSKAS